MQQRGSAIPFMGKYPFGKEGGRKSGKAAFDFATNQKKGGLFLEEPAFSGYIKRLR
jgi:hypothetical protein